VDTTDLNYNQATSTTFLTNISASNIVSVNVTASLSGTSSWSTNAITAAYTNGPVTGSVFGTASWAANITSSGITGNLKATAATASYVTSSNIAGTVKNAVTASQGAFAWGSFVLVGGTNITASTYNCSISRTSIGLYPVTFTNNATTTNYAVIVNAESGSLLPTTSSLQCSVSGKATTGFSIYTSNISVVGALDTLVLMDASTASFVVFSY